MINFTNEQIEAVKTFLEQEAEKVEIDIVDAENIYFNITQDDINFYVLAYPFFDEDDNIKGFEVEYREEGQEVFRGNGTLWLD